MRILFFLCLCAFYLSGTAQPSTFAWSDFSFGAPACRLKTPGIPQAQKANLPAEVLQRIKRYDGFYIDNEFNGIVVTMSHVVYTDDVIANQKGAIDGTNAQWRATGATISVHTTEAKLISGKSATEQQGSYHMGGKDYEFYDLVVTEGPKMWQIIVLIRSGDVMLRQTLNYLKNSIQF